MVPFDTVSVVLVFCKMYITPSAVSLICPFKATSPPHDITIGLPDSMCELDKVNDLSSVNIDLLFPTNNI